MSSQPTNGYPAKRPRVGERTMLACLNCKTKKLKCDGSTPKCRNCVRTGRECLVEDPATGLHRPRDYIQSLEARVAYLENLLHELRPDVANDHMGGIPRQHGEGMGTGTGTGTGTGNVSLENQPRFPQLPQTYKPPPPNEAAFNESRSVDADGIDSLSNEVALLCVNATGREPQYFGSTSAVSFSRIASAAMGLPRRGGGTSSQNSNPDGTKPRAPAPGPKELPSPAKMEAISNAYFTHIHPQYPFLHRPTLKRMEKECLDASSRGDLKTASDVSMFFVLMICAIGSLALGHTEVETAEAYCAMALEYINQLLELDNLQSIQAILCYAVYSIKSPIGVSLWKISGMAIRHCVELGYHRSAERFRSSSDTLTKEMSKRCFWVAYDIDRVASFILGRPVGIIDRAIDVELPLDISDEYITADGLRCEPRTNPTDPPTTMTGALHVIRLRQLWSKISDNLYTNSPNLYNNINEHHSLSIEALRLELEDWRAATPDKLDYSVVHPLSVFTSETWFLLAYDYSILLLYRPYIISASDNTHQSPPLPGGGNLDATERAFELCAEHARSICVRYRRLYQNKGARLQFTWGSLHILFLGGLTYLYCLWRSPRIRQAQRQTTIMQTCMACTTVLIIIAERWSEAAHYRDIFEALSERTINMLCGSDSVLYENTPYFQLSTLEPGSIPTHVTEPTTVDSSYESANLSTNTNLHDPLMPVQDWIMGLEYMTSPGDPRWLAQELIQGMRDVGSENF
ncbi:fungal-specific transcription factor domain-containing protein [Biscogniauxia mediterranea]|nr:fungal-specific transcription factor domain-containing protein [Biscogniauxia mediterranea]